MLQLSRLEYYHDQYIQTQGLIWCCDQVDTVFLCYNYNVAS